MNDQAELLFDDKRFVKCLQKSLNIIEAKNKKNKRQLTKYKILYHRINNMLADLTSQGGISAQDPLVETVMDALHDIDGGVYNENI